MSLKEKLNDMKTRLQTILESSNAAITDKGGAAASDLSGVPAAITALPAGGGDIVIGGLTYVPGTPVSFTLSGWDADIQGTTYTLTATGYKPGANGLQIGLPPGSSTVNTQAVVAAALTIADSSFTAATDSAAAYTTITISAVNAPDSDLTVAIFGLEAAE